MKIPLYQSNGHHLGTKQLFDHLPAAYLWVMTLQLKTANQESICVLFFSGENPWNSSRSNGTTNPGWGWFGI
jgi:hypothetical protein